MLIVYHGKLYCQNNYIYSRDLAIIGADFAEPTGDIAAVYSPRNWGKHNVLPRGLSGFFLTFELKVQ